MSVFNHLLGRPVDQQLRGWSSRFQWWDIIVAPEGAERVLTYSLSLSKSRRAFLLLPGVRGLGLLAGARFSFSALSSSFFRSFFFFFLLGKEDRFGSLRPFATAYEAEGHEACLWMTLMVTVSTVGKKSPDLELLPGPRRDGSVATAGGPPCSRLAVRGSVSRY